MSEAWFPYNREVVHQTLLDFRFRLDHNFFHQVDEPFKVVLSQWLLVVGLRLLPLYSPRNLNLTILDLTIQSFQEVSVIAGDLVIPVSPIKV